MSYLSLKEYASKFYEVHQEELLLSYPGLSLKRILDELDYYSIVHNICDLDTIDNLYIPSSSHPLDDFFNALLSGVPLEYINRRAYFYKSSFFVNSSVLIPRSETEILVETTVAEVKKNKLDKLSICDIGTGSGAILLSILADIDVADVNAVGFDLSADALEVAKTNYHHLGFKIDQRYQVDFKINDRLTDIEQKFDIIVSNPPYIKEVSDQEKVHGQVFEFEPHMALFIEDSAYDNWFEEFFKQVYDRLNDQGFFMMEGHEDHLEYQSKMAEKIFSEVVIVKDYTGRNRFLKIRK